MVFSSCPLLPRASFLLLGCLCIKMNFFCMRWVDESRSWAGVDLNECTSLHSSGQSSSSGCGSSSCSDYGFVRYCPRPCLVHFVYFAPWRRRRWRWRLLSVCIFQVLNFHCTCLCCCRTCFALVCFLYVSFLFPTRSLFACFFLCFWHYAKCAKPTKYQKIARCTCLPGRHFGLRRLFTTRERVSVEVRLL